MTDDEFDMKVREFAVEIMTRAAGDPIARMGIMHAATQMIVAFAIEEPDPFRTIGELTGDMHSEALTMAEMCLVKKELGSDTTNVIPMERLQ